MAKTKKKPPAKKPDGLTTQAKLESFVRYGGQLGELARMARDTNSDAQSRARDAVAAGEAISQSARMAEPELKRIYDSSLGEMNRREGIMRSELAKLGSGADSYKAGGLFTSTTAQNRTSGEKASALRELVGRRQDAVSGARYGAQQAKAQGASEVSKIKEKMLDVQAESGAYQAGRIGELKEGQRERANELAQTRERNAQSDRNSRRSANVQRERIESQERRDAAKPKGLKLQTPQRHEGLRAQIDDALRDARAVAKEQPRHATARDLTNDIPSQTIPDAKTGGNVNMPGRKGFDELVASIALDLAYDGHISRRNVQRLHNSRYSLKTLGLADKTGARAPKRGSTRRPGNAPSAGGARPT